MIESLTRKDFADLAPGALAVALPGRSLPLEVLETRDLPLGGTRAEPFAVIVAGPADVLLPQAIYPLDHPRLGRLDLFIVPLARDRNQTRYEIIFN